MYTTGGSSSCSAGSSNKKARCWDRTGAGLFSAILLPAYSLLNTITPITDLVNSFIRIKTTICYLLQDLQQFIPRHTPSFGLPPQRSSPQEKYRACSPGWRSSTLSTYRQPAGRSLPTICPRVRHQKQMIRSGSGAAFGFGSTGFVFGFITISFNFFRKPILFLPLREQFTQPNRIAH